MSSLGNKEGVLTDRGVLIRSGDRQLFTGELAETLQAPESEDAGFRLTLAEGQLRHERHRGVLDGGSAIHEDAEGIEADDLARMAEGCDETSGIGLRKVRVTEGGRTLVLDAVDATEVVLAVRTDRGARLRVLRATGVIVSHDGSIEVEDVHRTIWTEGDVNRTEPMVRRAKPLGIRQEQLTLEGGAIEHELLVVDDVENRFADEDRAIVFFGPRTVLIDGRRAGSRVAADLVDLQ